jgi:hypothetical protein
MQANNIQSINVYDDGFVEMIVTCNSCKKSNIHIITHASTKTDNKISIDFSKLGKRYCDNMGQNEPNTICYANYDLYKCTKMDNNTLR